MSSTPAASAEQQHGLPDPLPLVGRDSELARLNDLLGPSPGPILAFLTGASGLGKSRLVDSLASRASAEGWRIARGQAYPVEIGVPYALFADAWLPILRDMEESSLQVLSRGGLRELTFLFPALGDGTADEVSLGEDPEEFRTRLMWNFAEFVKRLAGRDPILILLEDLHWADESSLQLVHFLARQVEGHRVRIVCTYTDEERQRRPQLIRAEGSLSSLSVATVVRLAPLTLDDVAELIGRSFGVTGDAIREFAAVLFGWTRGNPFFVGEIVKSLVASGRLRRDGGTWVGWDARDFQMPGSIRDAVLQRLGACTEAAQTVAELTAVVGSRASYRLLESVSGLDDQELLDALEELCADRVLNEASEADEVVYTFVQPLVREILYAEVGLARARKLHGVVAEAMEEIWGADAVGHADELAFHFARTGSRSSRAKAVQYLAAAGRHALERRADREAVDYLEAALERAGDSDDGASPGRTELAPLLARAYTHLGRFDDAAHLWTAALEVLEPGTREHTSILRTLAMTHFWRGDHGQARKCLDAGLEAARSSGDSVATVRLLVAEAHCLHEVGRGTDALEALRPALPLAEEVGDPRLLARVHRALALLHLWVGPPDEAERHGRRAIELATEVGDTSIEFWARWGLAVLAGMRGNTAEMVTAIEQINELAEKARSPVLRLWTADMTVELQYGRADWDRGIVEGRRAIALARSLNQRTLLPRILVWTSQFFVARGELEEAEAMVREAEEISGLHEDGPYDVHQVVPTYIGKAYYLLGLGEYDAAIAAAEKGLEIAEGTGYVLWSLHQCLPVLAEACIRADRFERAREVGQRMREHSERIDHRLGLAWADACEALLRWKRGDPEGSIPLMQAASESLDSIPMMWHGARLRRQLAARLWEVGRAEEAKEELDRAWEVFVRVEAGFERERARADYRKMGLKAPIEHQTDGPLGLTPEELEIAKLVAEGLSNPEIAQRRGSSVRTVSTHLSPNIYKKLGIGGPSARMQLANMVREAGLVE